MTAKKKRATPEDTFRDAVNACKPLHYRKGLQAIKKSEGKGQISGEDSSKVLGSVGIDDDCRPTHPESSRWDYVVGYDGSKGVTAYYIEVHSAETSEISVVEKKLDWLLTFLQDASRRNLAALPREIHWVASGRNNLLPHTPQYKKLQTTLRKRGLRGPVKNLVLT
ncbi:hypothetical protein [Polyangium fumosum]|uniref:Uncharacterized protein n=1 Tax=Polyangium fumosum TaxID=889272 RepID=A0A4U1ICY1_9BACT|nr:hypothetical protein [Polyangium fumosum]TKC91471.1 hypothetical protein E8A74_50615 [Polyangium fumosum]